MGTQILFFDYNRIYTLKEAATIKIKPISDQQVKVLVENEDIRKYKIPFEKVSATDNDSMEFIYRLLFMILEETGISFLEDDLNVEVYPACGGNYYVMIAKEKDGDGIRLQKESTDSGDMHILQIEKAQDIRGAMQCLRQNCALLPHRISLYSYGRAYYLLMEFTPEQVANANFKILKLQLNEFGNFCRKAIEYEGILAEHGHHCGEMM